MIQKYSSVIIFSILMVHFRIKSNQNLQESYSFIEALVCHFRQIVNWLYVFIFLNYMLCRNLIIG